MHSILNAWSIVDQLRGGVAMNKRSECYLSQLARGQIETATTLIGRYVFRSCEVFALRVKY